MTLLEKLGDGFFGIVRKAYLFRTSKRSLSSRLSSRLSILSSQSRKDSTFSASEKLVVACKMLKGIHARVCVLIDFLFIIVRLE